MGFNLQSLRFSGPGREPMNTLEAHRIFVSSIGSALLMLAACGAEEPSAQDYDDLATSVGALVAEGPGSEMEAVEDTMDVAEGGVPGELTRSALGSVLGRRGSLDYNFEVTCRDAAGATLEACDATTDQADLVLSWNGEVDSTRYDASVTRIGNWQWTGLQSDLAELNGTGTYDATSEFIALFRNETRFYRLDADAVYEAVMVRTSDRRPVGGTIRYTIHAERTDSRGSESIEGEFDVTAVVTFQGDASARVEFDGGRTYAIDLSSGEIQLQQ